MRMLRTTRESTTTDERFPRSGPSLFSRPERQKNGGSIAPRAAPRRRIFLSVIFLSLSVLSEVPRVTIDRRQLALERQGICVMRLNPRRLWRYRPRIPTMIVFFAIAAALVLSNAAYVTTLGPAGVIAERSSGSYSGWPLVWYRLVESPNTVATWQIHPTRLAGDVAFWLILMATFVGGCEWLLRRYRPRLRWSLRAMLIAVALVATFCGWFVKARSRAMDQDPLIDSLHRVKLTRWGPRWLDGLGADRFRRQIVGAHVYVHSSEAGEEVLGKLARLNALQSLYFRIGEVTPPMAASLREMQQLRLLAIDNGGERLSHECLTAIGDLRQLEHLRLENTKLAADDFAAFANLTKLKSIGLEFVEVDRVPMLRGLPPLAQLEALDVSYSNIGNADLPYLANRPHLKRLNLHGTGVTDSSMQQLERIRSLEEVGIDDEMITERGLTALLAIGRLQKLHIGHFRHEGPWAELSIAPGIEVTVAAQERDGCLRALEALRQSKPGILITDKNDRTMDAIDYQLTKLSEEETAHRPNMPISFPWLQASFWSDTVPNAAKTVPW